MLISVTRWDPNTPHQVQNWHDVNVRLTQYNGRNYYLVDDPRFEPVMLDTQYFNQYANCVVLPATTSPLKIINEGKNIATQHSSAGFAKHEELMALAHLWQLLGSPDKYKTLTNLKTELDSHADRILATKVPAAHMRAAFYLTDNFIQSEEKTPVSSRRNSTNSIGSSDAASTVPITRQRSSSSSLRSDDISDTDSVTVEDTPQKFQFMTDPIARPSIYSQKASVDSKPTSPVSSESKSYPTIVRHSTTTEHAKSAQNTARSPHQKHINASSTPLVSKSTHNFLRKGAGSQALPLIKRDFMSVESQDSTTDPSTKAGKRSGHRF